MPAIILTGLPGTGKTHLALHLGSTLLSRGIPTLVLHTDILKITLRQIDPHQLIGPGYATDHAHKLHQIRPYLTQQVKKADREGYLVIIEGTLACGFCPPRSLYVLLQLDEPTRNHRIQAKHGSARRALQQLDDADLELYRQTLNAPAMADPLRLESHPSLDTLVAQILSDPRCPIYRPSFSSGPPP